jgi:hypothetical protein
MGENVVDERNVLLLVTKSEISEVSWKKIDPKQ